MLLSVVQGENTDVRRVHSQFHSKDKKLKTFLAGARLSSQAGSEVIRKREGAGSEIREKMDRPAGSGMKSLL